MSISPSNPNPDEIQSFFSSLKSTFFQAVENVGNSEDHDYKIAGHAVRLRFAGSALVPYITPALEHLSVSPADHPGLTICIWDSKTTNIKMPKRPWNWDQCLSRGEVKGFTSDRFITSFQMDIGLLSMLDKESGTAMYWIPDPDNLPVYERGAPLKAIFHWWMRDHDRLLVHAGAVGINGIGILLAGKGGTGKSTTAMNCFASGFKYLSDDYCLLSVDKPQVSSLYNTAKLASPLMPKFPDLIPAVRDIERRNENKSLIFLHQQHEGRLQFDLEVKAVLLPQITGGKTTSIKPATPAMVLRALAPSSIFQLPATGRKEFDILANFARKVTSFRLELGTDFNQIPEVIKQVINNER